MAVSGRYISISTHWRGLTVSAIKLAIGYFALACEVVFLLYKMVNHETVNVLLVNPFYTANNYNLKSLSNESIKGPARNT